MIIDPAGIEPGTMLGSYRIDRLLGRGGMGAVFLAYDTTLHRPVALKVMTAPADSETSRARLLREARSAAALNHPNICTIHEVGDVDGAAFIAMEYVAGRSLSDRLDAGPLPLEEALRYGIQAADALASAHEQGIIHRDFKAANAMVTEAGRLKIVDFGLARRDDAVGVDATTVATLAPAGTQVGTPYAMAPEQVRGEVADRRADLWALGLLLYEMVSGAKPFQAATVPDLFSKILRDAPAPLPGSVPIELRAIIERCLKKTPADRPGHAGEVRDALTAIQAGTTAPWVEWRYRLTRSRRAMAAVVVLLIIGAGVGLNVGGLRDRLVKPPTSAARIRLAVLPFENLTGDPAQEYFSDGLTEEMIAQLGRLQPERLSVIARSSSMQYKKRSAPIDQIGRELGVDYVMEGSTRREGNHVRISATLIQVRDQTQRWADTFERDLSSILALQSDVARGVARSLALTLLPAEEIRLANSRLVNPEAYEAYLKGVSHGSKLTRADLDTAERYFAMALEKDPDYALAYTGIATVWSGRQQMGFLPPAEAAPRMRTAVTKALELDSTLAEAHHRLAGMYAWTDWNWAAAEPEFRRTMELGPNYAEGPAFYSHFLYIMKRPAEALPQIQRARELDPLSVQVQALYARDLVHARQFNEAIVEFQKVLATNPDSPQALNNLAEVYFITRRYDDALAMEKRRFKARGDEAIEQALSRGADGGYANAMRLAAEALDARSKTAYVPPVDLAGLYLRAGRQDRALAWLDRSFEMRDPMLPYISAHPIYDPLRGDARFQDLLRRMNLPGP